MPDALELFMVVYDPITLHQQHIYFCSCAPGHPFAFCSLYAKRCEHSGQLDGDVRFVTPGTKAPVRLYMSLISGILVESCDVVRIIITARARQDISCTISAWSVDNEDPK